MTSDSHKLFQNMIKPESPSVTPEVRAKSEKTSEVQSMPQEEVAEMIDGVLGNLKTKFELLSSQILSRMDQMGERMDSLERSLTDLLDQSSNEDHK